MEPRNLSLAPVLDVFEEMKLKDELAAYLKRHPHLAGSGLELRGRTGLRLPIAVLRSFFDPVFAKIESKVKGMRVNCVCC